MPRYFVIDSEERRQYEQRQREKTMRRAHEALTKVQQRVASGRLKDPAKIGAAVERALQRHYGFRYYAWELKDGTLQITEHPVRLAQEKKYEGKYLLQTDQAEMTAADAVEQYKQFTEVERGFRSLKDPLALRPIRHRTTCRVRAHIFVAALAFLLDRLLERHLKAAKTNLSTSDAWSALLVQSARYIPHSCSAERGIRETWLDLCVIDLQTNSVHSPARPQVESMQQSIYLFDLEQGTIAWEKPIGWDTSLMDLAFSPNGQGLAVSLYPGKVQLWSVNDGGERFSFQGSALEFSPDGSVLATMPWAVDDDRRLYIYSTEDGSLLKQWEGERATFSPGGILAIEDAGAERLVDVGKNQVLQAFNGKSAAFSGDGQILALLDRDQIRLYESFQWKTFADPGR